MTGYCPFYSYTALSPSPATDMYQVTRAGEEYSVLKGYYQVWSVYLLNKNNRHPTPDYQARETSKLYMITSNVK